MSGDVGHPDMYGVGRKPFEIAPVGGRNDGAAGKVGDSVRVTFWRGMTV